MSKINNSFEYYQSNQSLLSMLNKNKTGNPLINQLISNNDMKFQQKMESMGLRGKKGQTKYKDVNKSASNLLDALENLSDKDLFTAEEGKEIDKSDIIKKVNNFITAYNSTVSNLTTCGGALYNSFKTEFEEAFKSKSADFEKLGITINRDRKLEVDGDKLNAAKVEDIKSLFGPGSAYVNNLSASVDSINTIIGKALAISSSNYNAKGVTLY